MLFTFDILWSGSAGDLRGEPLTSRKAVLAETLGAGNELARRKFPLGR